ncbi:MAG: hypothetical protein ABJF10_23625 [Chthoniobacter sp.]|uniref:hypothetical protein n=1 Tax=Chthoniobacter sp. TaxID=2510640 RepID=UPI0032A8A5D3
MNRRSILAFILVGTAAILHAQDKAATPKPEKAEKVTPPKVLTFQPVAKIPEGASDNGVTRGVVVSRPAEPNPMADGPSQIVATFFAALREGKIDDGYATLTKDSKIAEKPEELRQLKAKTREAIEVFGAISGYDFVESRAIGQRLLRATFVSQGRVFPLRWRFYFYKPEHAWRLIDMRVDDKLTGLFDEPEEIKPDELKSGTGLQ